jgi:hypothetical protein
MKTKTYYTLTIDGKEMAKSKLLSEVALKPKYVEDHYEITKYENGNAMKSWGYTVNPENNQRVPFTTGWSGTIGSKSKLPPKIKQVAKKIKNLREGAGKLVSTLKSEYQVRKNLKLLEKKVELFDL